MSAAATYEKASDQLGAIGAPSGKAARVGLCSMCGKAGASLTCTRCRDPLYCNRDCQVRDGMTPFVHVFGYFTVGTPKTPRFAHQFLCVIILGSRQLSHVNALAQRRCAQTIAADSCGKQTECTFAFFVADDDVLFAFLYPYPLRFPSEGMARLIPSHVPHAYHPSFVCRMFKSTPPL